MKQEYSENIYIQRLITIVAVVLFLVKIFAWYITNSVSILTDAMESTVNIISAVVGFYSLYLSAHPKDKNHPYGHGKAEFLSAAFEGLMIIAAGMIIIYEAVVNLQHPHELKKLDFGILLIAVTAVINYAIGSWAVKVGKKNNTLTLLASGKHLQTDTYSTIGIVAGLILISITGLTWLDGVLAMAFSLLIIYTGLKIIRSSLSGIMDEADDALLKELVSYLNENRKENWVDLHNLRIIKYGSVLHLDCHLTVPWYLNVHEAHGAVDDLSKMIRDKYGDSVELFVHTDGCLEFSCKICIKENCAVRQHVFVKKVNWDVENISQNKKHEINS
ncbi:MAG: cation diffusion facilitator family transporter [Bacteroidota bacterium]